MSNQKFKKNLKDSFFLKLAFRQAEINLGSTSKNPSVGCVIVKNDSVVSSAPTSLNGRPHAEANALNKKEDFKRAKLFSTLEPCSHYGVTTPCVKKIIKKKISHVSFSIIDSDLRSKNKSLDQFKKKKINVKKFILEKYAKNFYESYFFQTNNNYPYIDAKLAVSKDYFSINKSERWITNKRSRVLANFIRSKYNCILSTSDTINSDDPLLNCRIEGIHNKSPDIAIIDRFFKIKKNLKIFQNNKKKIFIFTQSNNTAKENYFKKKGINIVKLKKNIDVKNEISEIFFLLKKFGFNRILVESGVKYINEILKYNLIRNFYLFKSSLNLNNNGTNNTKPFLIKKLKTTIKNKVNINLNGDSLYKIQL